MIKKNYSLDHLGHLRSTGVYTHNHVGATEGTYNFYLGRLLKKMYKILLFI